MLRALVWNAAIATAMLFGVDAALAEGRFALVIGQSAYRAVPALPNPSNDARAIAALLGDAGFEVTSAGDLSQTELRQQVSDFAAKIAAKGPDTVALMFYAGHGIQVDGENYLIPVDVDPKREADIPLQAVRLNDVLNTLTSVPSKTRIIMLDACRNNPFPGIKSTAGHGLALVDTKAGAPGTLLSYSTSPGAEAEDGTGANSPYTTALLKSGRDSGLVIEDTFKRVRLAVNQATEGRQTPWESSSLIDDFRFFGAADAAATAAPPAKRTVEEWRTVLTGKPVAEANELIVADGSVDAYEAFVSLYAEPPFGPEAKRWLDRHRRMQAWNRAVLSNTGAAYRGFLEAYPDSDLTTTAKKLELRTRNRLDTALALSTSAPATLAATAAAAPATIPVSGNAALTCPCGAKATPPVLEKTIETKKPPKRAERMKPPKRIGRAQYYDDDEDVVVVRRAPVIVDAPRPVYRFGGGYRGPIVNAPGRVGPRFGGVPGRTLQGRY